MQELKKHVIDNYLNNIIYYENGIKFIYEDDLKKLNFTELETNFIMSLLEEEQIELRKNVIKKENRTGLVRDYNYGDIASNNLEVVDSPEKSIIEFDKEKNISFENYDELEKYLEEIFIPKYIQMKMKIDKNTNNLTYEPSIQLNHIVKLKLSELEVKHVFKYLENLDIKVAGISPDIQLDLDIGNYNYVRTFKGLEKPIYDNTLDDESRIEQYHQTNDILLRNKIIENNMRLATFIAYKYSIITEIDIHELESYAYEGLIHAVENFKNIGTKFSTYAYPCIRGFVLSGIPHIQGFYKSSFYDGYVACKKIVEETNETTIEEKPSLLKDVYELMTNTGRISGCNFSMFKDLIYISQPILMKDMDEIESDYDIEEEVLKNVAVEELKQVLNTLPEKEKIVIINLFGLFGTEAKTLPEVGKMFNVSKERIRQIEKKALWHLRHPKRTRKLM